MSSTAGADYSAIYDPDTDFDVRYTMATVRRIATRVAAGDRVLELGCATGLMTAHLAGLGARVTGIDRSEAYLDRARARLGGRAAFVRAGLTDPGWEDLAGDGFDHVLLCNLIHEVPDPGDLLARAAALLGPGGLVHLSLQNPDSIHRLVAVDMGLIGDVREVSDRGDRFGTLGLWGIDDLARLAGDAGLAVVAWEGVMLKPLPNALMAGLPPEVLDGFERAARHLPAHCAMNLLVLARG
ncbi:MAG TPA: methyltransferase domain-containing protein [Miltoncostaeaceae bacterium]|jgi:SAM-dependent methyltransferase|nr:methyltransferase domain-containing protein [Miltoncostaeaceae bacterium]